MADDFGSISIDAPETRTKKTSKQIKKTGHSPKPPSSPPAKKRKRGRALPILFFTLALLLASYSLLGFFAVPYYIKNVLPEYVAAHSEFKLEIEEVKANPFSFEISIIKAEIKKPGANNHQAPLLSIDSLSTAIEPLGLLHKKFTSRRSTLNGVHLALKKEGANLYNFGSLFKDKNGKLITNIAAIKESLFLFSFNNIVMENGSFVFQDIPGKQTHHGKDIKISLPTINNFDSGTEITTKPYFSAIINGSPIHFSKNSYGKDSRISCEVKDLDLPLYFSYLPLHIPFEIKSGLGTGSIDLFFNSTENSVETLTLGMNITATNITLRHNSKKASINIPRSQIRAEFQPLSRNTLIKDFQLEQPSLQLPKGFAIKDIGILLPDEKAGQQERETVVVEKITIKNGSLSLGQEAKVKTINLFLQNWSNSDDSSPAQLNIEAQTSQAQLSWQGKIKKKSAEGRIELKNFSLNDFFQYAGITSGKGDHGRGILSGQLDITGDKNSLFSLRLGEGKIKFNSVVLQDRGKDWLTAPIVTMSGVNLSPMNRTLGDISIERATLNINNKKLPVLFRNFSTGQDHIKLASLQIKGKGTLTETNKPTIKLASFSLKTDRLNEKQINTDNIKISAKTIDGGSLQGRGRTKLTPYSLWLETEFSTIKAETVLPYFSSQALFHKSTARLSGKGRFILPNTSFKGDIIAQNGSIKTGLDKRFSWQKASFKKIQYDRASGALKMDSIDIEKPLISWDRESNSPPPYQKAEKAFANLLGKQEEERGQFINIKKISFTAGTLTINDKRMSPTWREKITNFSGTIEPIDSKNKGPITFKASGKIKQTALTIHGNMQVFAPGPSNEYTLRLTDIPPELFAKQSRLLREKTLARGFNAKIYGQENRQKSSTITDIEFISPSCKDKRLTLLMALLQGQNSHPKISILSQTQKGTSEKTLLEETEKYINKLLIKSEISPFLVADKSFKDLIDKSSMLFRFGQISLSEKGMHTLIRLQKFLLAYPLINIQIRGEASLKADRQALQEQLTTTERKRVEAINKKRLANWQAERRGPELATDEEGFIEENIFIPLQAEPVDVSHEMLLSLAQQRSEMIANVFTKQLGLAKERVRVIRADKLTEKSDNKAHFYLTAREND
ncbi:conserved hypothetical protein [Desulfotalea psychrophila LSv54]|uniref:DUF748 domain-containing protein n=2 Tax=Desulfotalea psychrophila TaxID=84980 RepID=Q6AMQ8_DESPS|nr:conserved hypothetical protein [Desulfotalea psychrophila LSv54]